ncbi:MAG TPA: response regulator transcription factor [Roseiflexaceae bacterium]|nr:response regulator transcription factor [Roseiflexaceae bacterium]
MTTTVLLVEDDQTARMLLADGLAGAGYHVTQAPNGEAALALLEQQSFDVVVTDIKMRRVDGIQVLNAAKCQPYQPAVILLTGFGSLETSIAALRAGAHDYLLKPCDPPDLLKSVAAAVRRRSTARRHAEAVRAIAQNLARLCDDETAEPQPLSEPGLAPAPEQRPRYLSVGRLVIDTFRHSVSFADEPVHATPIEYALLSCLAEGQGRLMTYSEIVRRTHGYAADEDEAQLLLKAHVRNLRRKIPPDYLINVRGSGYMMAVPETNT